MGLDAGAAVLAGAGVALLGPGGVGLEHGTGDGLAGCADGLLRQPLDHQRLHPPRHRVLERGGEFGQDLDVRELHPALGEQADRAREPAHHGPRLQQPPVGPVRGDPQRARDLFTGLPEVHQRVGVPGDALQRLGLQPRQQLQLQGLQPAQVPLDRHQRIDPPRRRQLRAHQTGQPRRAARPGHTPRQLRHHNVVHTTHPQVLRTPPS